MIDDLGACGVDEEGAWLQSIQHGGVDQPLRVRGQRDVHAEYVALRSDVGRRCRQGDLKIVVAIIEAQRGKIGLAAAEMAAPDREMHAERACANRHRSADRTVTDQPQRPALDAGGLRELLLVPLPGTKRRDVVGNAAVEREQQAECELGDSDGVLARTVRDVDAARRGRGDVNRVVAGAGTDDQGERTDVHHRGGHLRRAHDEHVGARVPQRLDECLVGELRVVEDLAAGGLEAVDAGLLELIGDKDNHGVWVCPS